MPSGLITASPCTACEHAEAITLAGQGSQPQGECQLAPPNWLQKELEDYWRRALDRISVLEFELDHATWEERRRELNVVYEANVNGERKRACETMQFDTSGRQIGGEAFYGQLPMRAARRHGGARGETGGQPSS
jgi:hypothetical protein